MPWGVNDPETAIPKEVERIFIRSKRLPFVGRLRGRGKLLDWQFGDLGIPNSSVEGAIGFCRPAGSRIFETALAAEELRVRMVRLGREDMIPVAVADTVVSVCVSKICLPAHLLPHDDIFDVFRVLA